MPTLVWAFFIAVLCGIPGKDLPSIGWFEMLSLDKFVHASMFGMLYFLGFRSQFFTTKLQLRYFIVFCILYGGSLEILQGLIFVDRSADIYDFIANSIGVFAAIPAAGRFTTKQN